MLWKELFAATAALQLGLLGRIAALLLFVGATAPAYLMFLHEMARNRRPGVGMSELLIGSLTIVTLLELRGAGHRGNSRRGLDHRRKGTR